MLYTQMTNANLSKVGDAMMAMCDAMDSLRLNPGEKLASVTGMFSALTDIGSPLHGKTTVLDLISVSLNMKEDAKRTKKPEYGAAVRYVQKEILG